MYFTIYIDDLLGDLCKLGVGCHWDSLFAGALCYADDLVLRAPSPSALRIMLNCCENFVTICGLKFNLSKTQLIRFSSFPSSCCTACFYFCGQQLLFLTLSHILVIFFITISVRFKILTSNCVTWSGRLIVYLIYLSKVGPHILTRLFKSYCLSLYGSGLWSLSSLLYKILKSPLTRFFAEFGVSPLIVILVSFI